MKGIVKVGLVSILWMSAHAQAVPIELSPGGEAYNGTDCGLCGPGTSAIHAWLDANVAGFDSGDQTYKSNEDGDATGSDGGDFAGDYTTTFGNIIGDPSEATISWDGGDFITNAAWLLVKDGGNSPIWYLFDISGWDGMMDIEMTGFWPGLRCSDWASWVSHSRGAADSPEPNTPLFGNPALRGVFLLFPGLCPIIAGGRPRAGITTRGSPMRSFCTSAILAATLFLNGALAQTQEDTDLVLILDASNSMWGQIDGVNKIVIAREAVGGLIDDIPDNTDVGLIAYGHRREGDCEDIEVLSQIEPVDKEQLKTTINGINPKGRTPITSSINSAIDLVRGREQSSIVLISDGLETCDLDPCDAVRTAKAEGLSFVLHVIGFDVAGEDTAQLECAAQAGGGLYLSAENAPELSTALQSAYEKPVEPDGRLIVAATANGDLQDALVQVSDANTGAHVAGGRTYVSSETNPRSIPLEDGEYRATVSPVGIRGASQFEFDFEIVDGGAVEREFDFSAGELSIHVTRNGELSDAVVRVHHKDERTNTAGGRTYTSPTSNPKKIELAAGTYDVYLRSVEMRNGPEPAFEDVVVLGKETTELSYEFVSGNLRTGTRRGDTLVDSVINIIDADGKNVGGGRTYTTAQNNPKEFVLAPGDYTVRISEIRGEKREVPATVVQGETTDVLVDLGQP